MDPEYIESMIEDAESSIIDAKNALELSRIFLTYKEFSESTKKLQNALYYMNKTSEIVVLALNKLELHEKESSK